VTPIAALLLVIFSLARTRSQASYCTVPCLNGKQGTELADVIVNKIKEAVDKVTFK